MTNRGNSTPPLAVNAYVRTNIATLVCRVYHVVTAICLPYGHCPCRFLEFITLVAICHSLSPVGQSFLTACAKPVIPHRTRFSFYFYLFPMRRSVDEVVQKTTSLHIKSWAWATLLANT
jgi:hypothetical protein